MKCILAILFVAGFSVGIGFLAIPTIIGLTGFWIGVFSIFLVWLFGIASGQLYLEAFLAVPQAKHLTSLTRKLSTRFNTVVTSLCFLFFNYCILITYYIFIHELMHKPPAHFTFFSPHIYTLLFTLFVLCVVTLGRSFTIGSIGIFFLGYLAFFIFDLFLGKPSSMPQTGAPTQGYYIIFAIPAIFNASFYQSILPSLIRFLKYDRKSLNKAVWIGYTLAMVTLILWIWLTLRPGAYDKFLAAFETKVSLAEGILFLEELPYFKTIFRFLAIFAIITSFLSVVISMNDYFDDLFAQFQKYNAYLMRLMYALLTLIPSLILSWIYWSGFVTFSTISTAIAEFLLATFLPISWVWSIRYTNRLPYPPILGGGKKMLLVFCFAAAILFFLLGSIPLHQLAW